MQLAAGRLAADLHVPVATLAPAVDLSPSQIRARFSQMHGCSPRCYRWAALLVQARRLLVVSGTTVAEIAASLDFSAHAHFTRGYHRAGGETPSGWWARMDAPGG